MKAQVYKQIPFAILFPIFLVNWFTSADSDPVWIKPLVYGVTIILLAIIFFIVNFVHFPEKADKKTKTQSASAKQNFQPHYLIPGFTVLPIIAFNIANSSLSTPVKAIIIFVTFGLIALIFGLTIWLTSKKKS